MKKKFKNYNNIFVINIIVINKSLRNENYNDIN